MNKLLALRRVAGKHAGENQAQIVLDVLEGLQIKDRIGCLGGDNAASNDTAMLAGSLSYRGYWTSSTIGV